MVLELLYQDWESHGNGSLALSVEDMTGDLGGASAIPEVYPKALERLVRSVDPCTQSVLNLASVLGRRLNDVSLYMIADLSVGQTMTGMAELVSRRVLRDGGKGLEFVNELVRTAAYLGVPSPLRRALHSHIADRLIAKDGPAVFYRGAIAQQIAAYSDDRVRVIHPMTLLDQSIRGAQS